MNLFPEKGAPIDCGLGHACQFCAQEDVCTLDKPRHNRVLIENRLAEIGQIVVVLANKGGVGKSTISANLAAGLATRGFRVGVADADVHGPNQSRFFGFAGQHVRVGDDGVATKAFASPNIKYPVQIGSLAFLLGSDDTPVVWRDAYKHDFIHHLMGSFDWGALDFLIVDMPPGTGNELITLCDMLEGANVSALLVTTAQAVALMDSMKAAKFCQERGLPLLGTVENMAGVICPHCTGEFHLFPDGGLKAALDKAGVASLAKLPMTVELAGASDAGAPLLATDPDGLIAKAMAPVIDAVAGRGRADFDRSVASAVDEAFAANLGAGALEEALVDIDQGDRDALRLAVEDLLTGESERLQQSAGAKRAVS